MPYTTWKVSVFGVFLDPIFPHSDWIWTDTPYLSVFNPNAEKYGIREKIQYEDFSRSVSYQFLFDVKTVYDCFYCKLFKFCGWYCLHNVGGFMFESCDDTKIFCLSIPASFFPKTLFILNGIQLFLLTSKITCSGSNFMSYIKLRFSLETG